MREIKARGQSACQAVLEGTRAYTQPRCSHSINNEKMPCRSHHHLPPEPWQPDFWKSCVLCCWPPQNTPEPRRSTDPQLQKVFLEQYPASRLQMDSAETSAGGVCSAPWWRNGAESYLSKFAGDGYFKSLTTV